MKARGENKEKERVIEEGKERQKVRKLFRKGEVLCHFCLQRVFFLL